MRNLEVPYRSEWDTDAGATNNDCGPASIAMVLDHYGENVKIDEIFAKTGADKGMISVNQLQKAIAAYGYTSNYEKNVTPARIKELIDKDLPPIALIHYGSLVSTQDKKFKGGHFLPVVGYYDGGYYCNDPNFWGTLRQDGDHHNYTKAEFEKAWNDCTIDGNPVCSLLWIDRKQPTASQDQSKALKLLVDFKNKQNHGNLEGALRSLLGDHDRLVTLQTDYDSLKNQKNAVQLAVDAFLKAIGVKKDTQNP